MEDLDQRQKFVFQKIKQGLKTDEVGKPMDKTDRERLLSKSSIEKSIPTSEWNDWSRRIHHSLQVAFLNDTENVSNFEALEKWRKNMVDVVDDAFQRVTLKDGEFLVLESAATHFVKNDLFIYLKRSEKQVALSEKERRLADALDIPVGVGGGGCLGATVVALVGVLGGALLSW